MFKVITSGFSQEFERWTDALETAKSLMPKCRWTEDIRIFLFDELVWVYSKSHKYPQYIGAGNYDRLARLFIQEAIEAEGSSDSDSAG
jgi:sulfur relay (sulfurtransferase) complex TusBCD TusD component (DsrE family)